MLEQLNAVPDVSICSAKRIFDATGPTYLMWIFTESASSLNHLFLQWP